MLSRCVVGAVGRWLFTFGAAPAVHTVTMLSKVKQNRSVTVICIISSTIMLWLSMRCPTMKNDRAMMRRVRLINPQQVARTLRLLQWELLANRSCEATRTVGYIPCKMEEYQHIALSKITCFARGQIMERSWSRNEFRAGTLWPAAFRAIRCCACYIQ